MMMYDKKLILLEYLYNNDITDPFELKVKEYFDKYIITFKSIQGIMLEKNGVQKLYVLRGKNWIEGEPEDYKDMQNEIMLYVVPITKMNLVVGFITNFKSQYMIYKVKDMTLVRHKGARCDQAGKTETMKLLNRIYGEDIYNKENTKKMVQMELCAIQEMILRYYDSIQKDGKRWFFTPVETIINRIMEIKI